MRSSDRRLAGLRGRLPGGLAGLAGRTVDDREVVAGEVVLVDSCSRTLHLDELEKLLLVVDHVAPC